LFFISFSSPWGITDIIVLEIIPYDVLYPDTSDSSVISLIPNKPKRNIT
jgi:hypothetical protein